MVCLCGAISAYLRRGGGVTRLLSYGMLDWWSANGSTALKILPCTHSLIPHIRLNRLHVSFFKVSVWPDWESNATYQLQWHVVKPLYHLIGRDSVIA